MPILDVLSELKLFLMFYPDELQTHEALSSDMQKNVLYALVRMSAVKKTKV